MSQVTEAEVYEALRDIYDPEIPMISIVDLGLVYDVKVNDGEVDVTMTLTAMGCPMAGSIGEVCKERIAEIPGVKWVREDGVDIPQVGVHIVWDPPWTPEKITEEGKRALGWE